MGELEEELAKLEKQKTEEKDADKSAKIQKSINDKTQSKEGIQKRITKLEAELQKEDDKQNQVGNSLTNQIQLAGQANNAINAAQGPFTYRRGTQSTSAMVFFNVNGVQYELHWHSVATANHTLQWAGNSVTLPFDEYAGRARRLLQQAGAPQDVLTWA